MSSTALAHRAVATPGRPARVEGRALAGRHGAWSRWRSTTSSVSIRAPPRCSAATCTSTSSCMTHVTSSASPATDDDAGTARTWKRNSSCAASSPAQSPACSHSSSPGSSPNRSSTGPSTTRRAATRPRTRWTRPPGCPPPPPGPDIFSRTIQANIGIGVGMIALRRRDGRALRGRLRRLPRPGRQPPGAHPGRAGRRAGFLGSTWCRSSSTRPTRRRSGTPTRSGTAAGSTWSWCWRSVLLLIAAVWLGQRLKPRFGNWNATLLAGRRCSWSRSAIVMVLLPAAGPPGGQRGPVRRPRHRDAAAADRREGHDRLARVHRRRAVQFRLYSVGAQLLLWAAIALIFAPLADRLLAPGPARAELRPPSRRSVSRRTPGSWPSSGRISP